uniref:Uncharacterized protein n=1 Tax=Picea glauca TaxID=3330 RepID=A0A117NFX9_PICGL|nr:hypothetical protein ABT39_MTgene2244 [Picea glauca]
MPGARPLGRHTDFMDPIWLSSRGSLKSCEQQGIPARLDHHTPSTQNQKDGSLYPLPKSKGVYYRALNKLTIKNKYPLPLIADCFDRRGEVLL